MTLQSDFDATIGQLDREERPRAVGGMLSPEDSLTLIELVRKYEAAIRRHRDYRGDDRCHLDDGELYVVLPEGDTRPIIEMAVTPENCLKFMACRQQGREYVSPQRYVEKLEARVRAAEAMVEAKDKQIIHLFERIGAQGQLITKLVDARTTGEDMSQEIARWLDEGNPNG